MTRGNGSPRSASGSMRKTANLTSAAHARLLAGRAALDRRTAALEALSPVAILNRGYALVFDANGQLVKDATRLKPGDDVSARLARGTRPRPRQFCRSRRRNPDGRCIRMKAKLPVKVRIA